MEHLTFAFPVPLTKICTQCKAEKPLSLFSIRILKGGKRVPGSWCCACVSSRTAAWWRDHPEKRQEHVHRSKLRKFGLTQEDYDALLIAQGGRCGICGAMKSAITASRTLDIDHDRRCCPGGRSCGKCVRGLLCRSCNLGLGQFGDDLERLGAAIRWLEAATDA